VDADIRSPLQQLSTFEPANSFAQRTTANAKRCRQPLLAQFAARLQVSAHDRRLNPLGERIHQRLRRDLMAQNAVHERLSKTAPWGARTDTRALSRRGRNQRSCSIYDSLARRTLKQASALMPSMKTINNFGNVAMFIAWPSMASYSGLR
jgi:hypothetical protein